MNKLFWVSILAIFTLVCTSLAVDIPDIAGTSGHTTYSNTDVFGTILGTYPWTGPGTSNAWCGMAFANGFVYQFKNIASPMSTQMLQVNPATGAIVNTYTLPFSGWVMDASYDGSGIWVAQWYPTNTIWKFSLTGATVSSFPAPSLGTNWSARCPNWDGTYLWVGYDSSTTVATYTTKLVKMSTTGVIAQQWYSNPAVSWYMGGEFSDDAPAGANLYVVDNVGNNLKRLNLGVTITTAASVASPAVSPDVGEGLCFDGDALYHCGAYSSLSLVWRIDDGYANTPPALVVTITPTGSTTVPSGGGVIPFTITILNNGPAQPYAVWGRVKNPNGTYNTPNVGPITVNTPVGATITRFRNVTVPSSWVAGGYYQLWYGNTTYTYPVIDADSFAFTKTAEAGNGPIVLGPSVCSGELFPGEVAVSAPASYAVATAFPNPFNPNTTIHYTLPEASKVTLNVYDMNGRLVSTLVNGLREAGENQATFDGSNLSSGVYMYTLNAGHNVITGKMALVK